jgi:deoxyribodipyrimidine photo-lyase
VEYGAYTISPKIKKLVHDFIDFTSLSSVINKTKINIISDDNLGNIDKTLSKFTFNSDVKPSKYYHGGYVEASKMCSLFIEQNANHYLESNNPGFDYTSKLSMYLHFGQISSLEIYERMTLALEDHQVDGLSYDAFVEQLVIRRELAFNYVYYRSGYDQFDLMTENWAYMTMSSHDLDFKSYLYSLNQLEMSETHDPYFNAAIS